MESFLLQASLYLAAAVFGKVLGGAAGARLGGGGWI